MSEKRLQKTRAVYPYPTMPASYPEIAGVYQVQEDLPPNQLKRLNILEISQTPDGLFIKVDKYEP